MTDFIVHPAELATCAKNVGALTATSTELNDTATTASVPAISWGALGHLLGMYEQYDALLGDLHGHFGKMTEGFGKIDAALTATAQTYADNEKSTTDAFGKTLQSGLDSATAPPMVPGGKATSNAGAVGSSYGEQYSGSNVGKQAAKSVPFGGSSYSLMKNSAKLADDIASGDGEAIAKDVVSVISDMNNFMQEGMKLAGAIADPLNFLISKGLGWLLDVVAPLKQAAAAAATPVEAGISTAKAGNEVDKVRSVIQKIMDVLKKIRDVIGRSKIGKAFVEGAAKKPDSFGKALSEAGYKAGEKALGLDQSGPKGSEYTDPVKIANKVAGYADGIYKTVKYDQHGADQEADRTDQELDI